MEYKFRCDCPFTSAIDILGDKWMLVLVKQMLLEGKETFKDFVESDEAIATNILSAKLKLLEELGMKVLLPDARAPALFGALFCETNPIPIKAAMELAGAIGGDGGGGLPAVRARGAARWRARR